MTPIQSKYLLLIALALLFNACGSSKKTKEESVPIIEEGEFAFRFVESDLLSKVLDKAAKDKKLVYLDMGAKWCVPCKLMKRDVYTHTTTAAFFNDNFVNYLVDGEVGEGPDLRLIFEVNGYPTLMILDPKGKVIRKRTSALYHQDLVDFASEALDAYKMGDY